MSGRVAVVAGAGGALGRATAETLAASGFTVVAVDRDEQSLRELPDGINREVADATDPAAARELVDRIAAEVGPPEVLVNCLGSFRPGEAVAATPEDLRILMDVNLGAALWLSQAVTPHMRRHGSGSIVHVSARPGTDPTAGMAAYSLSKAALDHLVRVLDLELRPLGIRVNAVAPQLLDTPTNPRRSRPTCWRTPSGQRRSRMSSPFSPVTSPRRSVARSSRPTAPDSPLLERERPCHRRTAVRFSPVARH